MTQIAPQFLHISKAASAADELFKIIDKQSAIDPFSDEGKKPQALTGTIDIRGVHLSYPARPDTPILKGMNLKIPPKKTTALVGSSGCGKSTLVGLLERWYEPSRGGLSLDGENIKDLNLRWLRSDLRVVQQEPVLFHGTIYENVLYGLQGTDLVHLSDEEKRRMVEEACIDAYAHDFIILLPKVISPTHRHKRSRLFKHRATIQFSEKEQAPGLVVRNKGSQLLVALYRNLKFFFLMKQQAI